MHRKLLALAITASLSGCGTVLNLRATHVPAPPPGEISTKGEGNYPAPKLVYGGVRIDAMAGPGWFEEASNTPPLALVGAYTCLVDLPICVVTDTLTLPVTIPAAIGRSKTVHGSQVGANKGPDSISAANRDTSDRETRITSASSD